jgi:antitoxin component of MazEF toxin-antitoxin module
MLTKTVKLRKRGNSLWITIPAAFVREHDLKPGDEAQFTQIGEYEFELSRVSSQTGTVDTIDKILTLSRVTLTEDASNLEDAMSGKERFVASQVSKARPGAPGNNEARHPHFGDAGVRVIKILNGNPTASRSRLCIAGILHREKVPLVAKRTNRTDRATLGVPRSNHPPHRDFLNWSATRRLLLALYNGNPPN